LYINNNEHLYKSFSCVLTLIVAAFSRKSNFATVVRFFNVIEEGFIHLESIYFRFKKLRIRTNHIK